MSLAAKEFIEQSKRTTSSEWYPNTGMLLKVSRLLREFIVISKELDSVKKSVFYGKNCYVKGTENNPDARDLIHSILGIITESGELAEILYEYLADENSIDYVNLSEEVGDLLWYQAMLLRSLDKSFEDVMHQNIEKLKVRYPEKFDTNKALNRALTDERENLEKNN